jgi:hypothetical protein
MTLPAGNLIKFLEITGRKIQIPGNLLHGRVDILVGEVIALR